MVDSRRPIKLLPGVNQTDTLTKFFAATVDHLFQPESAEFISAYVGERPPYYNPETDYYIGESSKGRNVYQLPVTALSKNPNSGKVTNIMFYDDFVNLLRFHGANTQDHSRLFNTEYYSWSPPIDLDKLLNYTRYYWVPLGPDPIILLSKTRLLDDAVNHPQYTYNGVYQLSSTGEIRTGELKFTTGLIVTPTDDYDQAINGKDWIINRVGNSIELLPRWPAPDPPWDIGPWDAFGWSSEDLSYDKDYLTVERMLLPTNQWSLNNRWFHEDVLRISGTVLFDGYQQRAKRPIIEFESSLQLYDLGWMGRPPVNQVATANNVYQQVGNAMVQLDGMDISSIVGLSNVYVDGSRLNSGDLLLVTGDTDATVNNRVYAIDGLDTIGGIVLAPVGGPPVYGESIYCLFGEEFGNKQLWYDGTAWKVGQQRVYGKPPLFMLYDKHGVALDDVGAYPGSNFTGSTLFTYAIDQNANLDAELLLRASKDQFGYWLYDNSMVTASYSYRYNATTSPIIGYYYYRNNLPTIEFNNAWYKAPNLSRQYIVNDYSIAKVTSQLPIDQVPDPNPGLLPSIYVSRIEDGHETQLKNGTDYRVSSRVVTLTVPAQPGQRIIIRSWSNGVPEGNLGYYELPLNLTANPGNDQVTTVSQSQLLSQFGEIISNQPGFEGNPLGNNNWRDTPHLRSLGLSILQHRAPMPRTMILSSSNVTVGVNSVQSDTDPMLAMQYTQREYLRFYNRFITTLFKLQATGYPSSQPPEDWVSTALKQINLGKTPSSPYANSGPSPTQGAYCDAKATNPTYVPPTATRLGCAPAYEPLVYEQDGRLLIQCHDGARIVMADSLNVPLGTILGDLTSTNSPLLLTDPVAAAWLQFELDLFLNIPARYRNPEAIPAMNITRYTPGKWRTGEYTRAEFIDIQRPMFDKWVLTSQVDFKANTTWDPLNAFTWNYRSCPDRDGKPVPGYWQGMYRWFYDTDRPHTHPWEMLGFSQMPPWWTSTYGPAPYTSGNTYLWDDLATGLIRHGPRAGIDPTYARPGLLSCIPVDAQGNLLPPSLSGVVASLPAQELAKDEWIFGDGAPVESVWYYSNDYNFVIAEYSYLMKPVQFIEYNWDTLRTEEVFIDQPTAQWIYVDTDDRRPFNEYYVHRENPSAIVGSLSIPNESTLTYYGSCGIQHWISEYLVSRNLNITTYLGNVIRGVTAQLAHQMGGFVGSNLYMTADSFGQIGYTSQIVPSENVRTYLYKSAATRTSFYTGVIITQVREGWKVVGYDGVKQYFDVVPSNLAGPKTTVIVGKERVVSYQRGVNFVATVPYGTVYNSRQEVYDFLMSLQRFQQLSGWQFDQFDSDGNYIYDWAQSGKEFLFWSQGNWANGNFIALSPLAIKAVYRQRIGQVQFVNGIVGGTYPVLDKTGSPVDGQNLEVLRFEDTVTINTINNQGIFGLRLFSNTLESVIVIDNSTAFDDTIYDPLFNIRQPRLKLYAYRTNDWNGRVDAPGYFLYQDGADNQWSLVPNFEKTANDFRRYFNIDQPKNFTTVDPVTGNLVLSGTELAVVDVQAISEISKHQIGYQQRGYLQNLLLEDTTEFQFYQGFIRQKGTRGSINRLVRDTAVIPLESTFAYYEEYAFRASRFGSTAINTGIDFIIPQNQYINNPQQITVYGLQSSAREVDGVITMVPNDPRIVVPPTTYSSVNDPLFPLRKTAEPDYMTDLPTAGYVLLGETDFYVTNAAALSTLWSDQLETTKPMRSGDTVWQFVDGQDSWTVWQYNRANVNVINTVPATYDGGPTVINCSGNVRVKEGDTVVLEGISNITALNGTWSVSNVSSTGNSFTVPTYTYTVGSGGNVYVYKPVRFSTELDRDNMPPSGGWVNGDRAWVDKTDYGINGWTVYDYLNGSWLPVRTQNYQIDAALMLQAKLYNKVSLKVYGTLEYYDPAKGFIPGVASKNLDIIGVYDPASYTVGNPLVTSVDPGRAWGREKVGTTWWDLSTVRYLDYEQSDLGYRFQNWGKLAPGTSVDVYEWVASPVDPDGWTLYASTGQSFAQFGIEYTPTGTVRTLKGNLETVGTTDTFVAYTSETTYSDVGSATTRYYFWVKNSTTIPLPENRTVTTYELSNIISNPNNYGTPWYAAIDPRNILVAGIQRFLNADQTVLSMLYTHHENAQVDYKQWDLVKENDGSSIIPEYYWSRLKASLVGKDGLDNDVPDPTLSDLMRYGNLVRPRQSWFVDRNSAAAAYVTKANQLLSTILLVEDPNLVDWTDYFNLAEEPPAADSGEYQFTVGSLTARDALISEGLISNGQSVLVLGGEDTNNLWVIYRYDYGNTQVWTPTRVQSYNTPNYWSYVDWYLPGSGVDADTLPDYTVPNMAGRYPYEGQVGKIVKVLNVGNGSWGLYTWGDSGWVTVGFQDGTVAISSGIYDGSINTMSFGTVPFDGVSFDIYPWREFSNIIDGLRNVVFNDPDPHMSGASLYLNNLFFTMINFVLNEQGFVDWIFKTSFITLKGFNIPLSTSELYKPELVDSITDYINEAKPYHVKIRNFVTQRTWTDTADVYVTDFDNPKIGSTSHPSLAWTENYLAHPELIRQLKVKLVFDRVVSNIYGWDSFPWQARAWEFENLTYSPILPGSSGAFDRIRAFYEPGPNMIRKDDPNLIPGSDYRGVIIDGIGLRFDEGWDNQPWDIPVGWDAGQYAFDEYLDIILQGGIMPQYDAFFGTGTRTAWKLTKAAQDPALVIVWSDRMLRDYGVDWVIPNWVNAVDVISGGAGYTVGDRLVLDLVPHVAPTRITVAAVDVLGAITSVTLDEKGSYDIWKGGPLSASYDPYLVGTGAGAVFMPTWGGDTLVFSEPPSPNSSPNIFVLFAGTTFLPAPTGPTDFITDGYQFIQPNIEEDHPEERYPVALHESIRLDTYTQPSGGSPIIYMRIYQLDGVRDHFDLGVAPMDIDSVIAQIDGNQLTYGLANDYVINWTTNQMVFMLPPTGQSLQILTIGVGGTGTGIYKPNVVSPGSGYFPGDIVTFAGGVVVNNNPASVQVQSVRAVSAALISGGTNYAVGDNFILQDDINTTGYSRTELVVTSVDDMGTITGISISQIGAYTYPPTTQSWLQTGNGVGAEMSVDWGVDSLVAANQGTYAQHPAQPIEQASTSGSGVGATFETLYTSILDTKTYQGDGHTSVFPVDVPPANGDPNNMLVTLDGVRLINGVDGVIIAVSVPNRTVTVTPAPHINSVLTITVFSSNDFSFVVDNELQGQTGLYVYPITVPPYSTVPPYMSITVTINGIDMAGPPMQLFTGNGFKTEFTFDRMPGNASYLQVYSGNRLLAIGVDYTVIGNKVVMYDPPAMGTILAAVNIDPGYGYNYVLIDDSLVFNTSMPPGWGDDNWPNYWAFEPGQWAPQDGDRLRVITYGEDLSYGFQSEQFDGPCYPAVAGNKPGTYVLAANPWTDSTLMVWQNKQMQTLMYDYRLERIESIPGWDIAPWDTYGWQAEYNNVSALVFGDNIAHTPSDFVAVQYMTGRPERPATAFRTVSNGNIAITSTDINLSRSTYTLSSVMVHSDSIEVEDISRLTQPTPTVPGAVWIGDERVVFWTVRHAPTHGMPNRGFLETLQRGTLCTPSGNVSTLFETVFYDGNGTDRYFPTTSGTLPGGGNEVVFVNDTVQVSNDTSATLGTYSSVINPPNQPPGRYIEFNTPPAVGWRNVKIAAPFSEVSINSNLSHPMGSTVIDAGTAVTIPGGYTWEASPNGLQYSDSSLARFLLSNASTRS